MNTATRSALTAAAARLSGLSIHGRLSCREVVNAATGRTVAVIKVRLAAESTAQDERMAVAAVYEAAAAASVPCNVSLAA